MTTITKLWPKLPWPPPEDCPSARIIPSKAGMGAEVYDCEIDGEIVATQVRNAALNLAKAFMERGHTGWFKVFGPSIIVVKGPPRGRHGRLVDINLPGPDIHRYWAHAERIIEKAYAPDQDDDDGEED